MKDFADSHVLFLGEKDFIYRNVLYITGMNGANVWNCIKLQIC